MERGGTDRLKQLQKNWLIILALRKGVEAEEPLKDKVGIEEDFLFNFLKRDQKSRRGQLVEEGRFQMTLVGECFVSTNVILGHQG